MLRQFIRSDAFFGALFVARFVFWTAIERRYRAHELQLRKVLLADLLTTIFLASVTSPVSDFLDKSVIPHWRAPDGLPLALRFALYLLLADLGHYWIHRALHLPALWRFHKWHHSPTHMSWLAGNRETLVDRVLVTFPYLLLWPLLDGAPGPAIKLLIVFSLLKNDWMHLNVTWRLPWLQKVFITPRAHHLHHSADPAHFTKNLSPVFSFWDRLFGTWLDPEKTSGKLDFGIGEAPNPARLIIGL